MRISRDERDPGHRLYAEAQAQGIGWIVTLDGVRQKMAITADDLTGEVVRHAVDERGTLKLDPARPGEILQETVRGRVRITRRHPHWSHAARPPRPKVFVFPVGSSGQQP